MSKPWLVFSTGLAAGLALALGLSVLLPVAPTPADPAADHPNKSRPRTDLTASRPLSDSTAANALAEKISRLRRWLDGQEPKLDRVAALKILADWSALDLKAALQFVMDAKRFPGRNEALAYPLAILCSRDAASVIDWLHQNLTEDDRGTTAVKIIELIRGEFPAQAWALALADGIPVGSKCFSNAMEAFAQHQPREAVLAYAKLSANNQNMVAQALAGALFHRDAKAAAAWCESISSTPSGAEAALGLIQAAVNDNDPAAVADFLKRFNPDPDRTMGLLMQSDPVDSQMVQALISGLPDPGARQHALAVWAVHALESTPADTLKTIQALVPAPGQIAILSRGFSEWLDSDRSAAMAWLDSLSDPALVSGLRKLMVKSMADTDPKAFLAQLDSTGANDSADNNDTRLALMRLSDTDPAAAADWLGRHPEQAARFSADRIVSQYLDKDANAAGNWVAALPKGPTQDLALVNAVTYWADHDDLTAATKSLDAITDPSRRMGAMYTVFSQLTEKDSAAALRWAEAQGLSEETRMTWLAIAKRNEQSDLQTIY